MDAVRRLLLLCSIMLLAATACSSTTSVQTGERQSVAKPTETGESTLPAGDAETSDAEATPEQLTVEDQQLAERIDGLVRDCIEGSDLACDILFAVTEARSPQEAVALDCGGRGFDDTRGFCTSGVTRDEGEFFFDASSPGLADIADGCRDGDMTACDFLYFRSEFESDYEELGDGCGGRTDIAVPDCRTLFPG